MKKDKKYYYGQLKNIVDKIRYECIVLINETFERCENIDNYVIIETKEIFEKTAKEIDNKFDSCKRIIYYNLENSDISNGDYYEVYQEIGKYRQEEKREVINYLKYKLNESINNYNRNYN